MDVQMDLFQPPTERLPSTGTDCRFYTGDEYQVRMVDKEKRIIEGYGIVFNKESRLLGGWFVEIIKPEAVVTAMQNPDIRSEFNHEVNYLLGRRSTGTARFDVDATGVKYTVSVPRTDYGDNLLELVGRGDVKGSSFQFITAEKGDTWAKENRGGTEIWLRTVTNMALIDEIGPVTNPAYNDTTASAKRSFDTWQAGHPTEEELQGEEIFKTAEPPGFSTEVLRLAFG